jgi:YHS domain-containing protein
MEYTNEIISTDPVCGSDVIEYARQTVGSLKWEEKTFYFCSFQCRQRFEGNSKAQSRQAA